MAQSVISVIVPVFNEEKYIELMVESVLHQRQKNYRLELLIVDGNSTDNTVSIIQLLQKKYPFIKLIHNEKRKTPAAFNKGILNATGEYVAILGAHSEYDPDYLEICLEELKKNQVVAVSGKVIVSKKADNIHSLLIYYLLTSSFGVSNKSYRTAKEGFSDQCPYPVIKKSIFDKVGLYNEMLVRNQDNDMNYRIRKAGYKLYYTHKVSAYYYPKQTISELLSYAVKTGEWNAVSLIVNPKSLALRHIIPLFFTATILLLVFCIVASLFYPGAHVNIFLFILSGICLIHILCGYFIAFKAFIICKKPAVLFLPFLFFLFHFYYGWGILKGLIIRK